jgi:hypothetical protein
MVVISNGAIMRCLPVLFATLLLAACGTVPVTSSEMQPASATQILSPELEKVSVDSVVQFLLTAAATDFHIHGPSGPLRFHDVRIGHVTTFSAEKQYRLCGEFKRTQQGLESQWMPFVTIKTSGYEQYIGSTTFCQDSSVIWDNVGDLSSSLQSRFDSLR